MARPRLEEAGPGSAGRALGSHAIPSIASSSLVCQETNKALLKGIQVSAEIMRGPRVHKPATGDHTDLVAETADLMRVVATEKCRDVLVDCKAAEETPHLALRGQVKTPCGFVEKQHFRMAHECARDFDPPFHARAVRAHELARSEEHTSELQSLRHLVC